MSCKNRATAQKKYIPTFWECSLLRDLKSQGTALTVSTGSQHTVAEKWPHVEIPDNDPTGVSVPLELPPESPANSISVSVEITHPFRNDLTVDLTSPIGKTARLRDGGGAWIDNLKETWSSDSHAGLAGLTGMNGEGTWMLTVIDTSSNDVGTLEYVRISCS